jgi:hypothetical protein
VNFIPAVRRVLSGTVTSSRRTAMFSHATAVAVGINSGVGDRTGAAEETGALVCVGAGTPAQDVRRKKRRRLSVKFFIMVVS